MSEAILFVGKRGHGKTLSAVRLMSQYMKEGRTVATNINIYPEYLVPAWNKVVSYRLPDFPSIDDLELLPLGNPNPINEAKNGLLVLDEVASFLNSREWQQRDRNRVISWLAQSRKKGWDLVFLAQHQRMLDAQVRDSLCDFLAICRRADKIAIPGLSLASKWLFGKPMKFPKFHAVNFFYGFLPNAPRVDRWFYGGSEYYSGYDTLQKIDPLVGQLGLSCNLDAWSKKGRYMNKIELYRGVAIAGFLFGVLVGAVLMAFYSVMTPSAQVIEEVSIVSKEKNVIGVIGGLTGVVHFDDGSISRYTTRNWDGEKFIYFTHDHGFVSGVAK